MQFEGVAGTWYHCSCPALTLSFRVYSFVHIPSTRPPLLDNNPALTALESVQDEESSFSLTSLGDTVVARQQSINDFSATLLFTFV
jgi:hypothetical protein